MLIGIDGNEANTQHRVGIGQYVFQLLRHLKEINKPNVRFKIYLKNPPLSDLPKTGISWHYQVIGPKLFWTQIALPVNLFLDKEKPAVFFSPSHYAPRFAPCSRVISIMDLSFIYYPEMFHKRDLYQLKSWTSYSVKKASKILTISNYSKETIANYYHVPQKKIFVTYPGYDDKLYKIHTNLRNIAKIKDKYGIKGKYILYIGTLQPRKNLITLIDAFDKLLKDRKFKEMQLVIVGKKGWLYEEIFTRVKQLNLQESVVFTGFVPEEEKPVLYKYASCFVLPSFFEGFGLPVIEAMACGTPVMASNTSSLKEIVKDAGILFEPKNTEELHKYLSLICIDKTLRAKLVDKGLKRAKDFNWENCARKTLEVLESAQKVI